jgi:hypothetical protein
VKIVSETAVWQLPNLFMLDMVPLDPRIHRP